jgi:hypothetical protein
MAQTFGAVGNGMQRWLPAGRDAVDLRLVVDCRITSAQHQRRRCQVLRHCRRRLLPSSRAGPGRRLLSIWLTRTACLVRHCMPANIILAPSRVTAGDHSQNILRRNASIVGRIHRVSKFLSIQGQVEASTISSPFGC